ncbi:class I SAM-dependent methyltransferase [Uliginosibacterium sp. 31-16]|uniref:class I SAM-dependent methyltransferase n=1 Tax=Uliginosibacterium sp. 31-16 TaxID=3068315 RepID=UPI00273F3E4A|nr:class I SAM-dependent methyltransferase [Uliginosibacterium sp. 31-16]MDP5238452.1 class I SAM-dependent methyltransferase [Uliginosibacterium sp. 31-16]
MKIDGVDVVGFLCESASRSELWNRFLHIQRTRVMAEIGVWKGDFAADVLKTASDLEIYYMIDPWANLPDWNKPFNVGPEVFDDIYREMDVKTAFAAHKRRILRGRTKEVIDKIPDKSLDFAYIDGDHTLRGITIDLIKVWGKVKPGGFIGGDDFTTTPWQHDVKFEPTMVCPFSVYFAEAMNVPIIALGYGQFLIQKDERSGFSFRDSTGEYGDLSLNKFPPSLSL